MNTSTLQSVIMNATDSGIELRFNKYFDGIEVRATAYVGDSRIMVQETIKQSTIEIMGEHSLTIVAINTIKKVKDKISS